MFNSKNKKKFIFLGIIAAVFLLYIIFAFSKGKPTVEEDPDVSWGNQGQPIETKKPIESYVSVNENEVDLSLVSAELSSIIKNPKINLEKLGEYYIYDGFYVFPQRQIKIKKSYDRILNIVFFDEYKSEILKNINVQTSGMEIATTLGLPNYNENDLLVYKTKDYYMIFDTKNHQASAYLRYNENLTEFWEFYETYLEKGDLKKFISDVTRKYPSYTKYSYDVDGLELIYADLGIRLYFKEFDDENGIYLYSNYYNENEEFSADNLNKKKNVNYKNFNLVMKEEIERIADEQTKATYVWPDRLYSDNAIYKNINVEQSYLNKVLATESEKEYKPLVKMDNYTVYLNFNNINYTFSNVSIISKTGNKNFNINTAKVADNLLLTEKYVFYSIVNEGVFRLDVNTGKVTDIYVGEGVLELKYVKDGYLYFDDVKTKVL